MIHSISDVILISGVKRFEQLEHEKMTVARKVQAFSPMLNESVEPNSTEVIAKNPIDLGAELVTLTRNGMEFSMLSRLMSVQLGLYSTSINEGRM